MHIFVTTVADGQTNKNSAEMGDRLAKIDMGQKVREAAVPLSMGGEELGAQRQCRLGRGLPLYEVAS